MSEQEQKQTEDFNEVLEKVEVESSKEVNSDENLQEFKSSHGVDAEIPDAKAAKTEQEQERLNEWLDQKKHADMEWIENRKSERGNIFNYFSTGQLLCLPMVIIGFIIYKK